MPLYFKPALNIFPFRFFHFWLFVIWCPADQGMSVLIKGLSGKWDYFLFVISASHIYYFTSYKCNTDACMCSKTNAIFLQLSMALALQIPRSHTSELNLQATGALAEEFIAKLCRAFCVKSKRRFWIIILNQPMTQLSFLFLFSLRCWWGTGWGLNWCRIDNVF